jgi:poly(3-hydroxybutyrate) depolymerase
MLFTSREDHAIASPIIGARERPLPLEGPAPEVGKVLRLTLNERSKQIYYLYVPHRIKHPGRLFVTVHGISRNAREHAERFAPLAEQQGVVLVAPRFSRRRFASYQRLAPRAAGQRSDAMLDRIVSEVREQVDLPEAPLYLFGYSGGGQFVHRYAIAHPARVARAVIGAAGWYTFPDPRARYPRGLRFRPDETLLFEGPDFLKVPMAVIVGGADVERDPALNQSPRIDRQQGGNRCERGRRWVAAMQEAAQAQGLATRYQFQVLPGVGHDFTSAMVRGGMGEAVFDFLFGGQDAVRAGRDCAESSAPIELTWRRGPEVL